MAVYPAIDRRCPYERTLSDILDGNHCSVCDKHVHDLDPLSDRERLTLLERGGPEEICVRYSAPRSVLLAALALGAGAVAAPAFAQEQAAGASPPAPASLSAAEESSVGDIMVIAGGVRHPPRTHRVKAPTRSHKPSLPVIVEEQPAGPAKT